MDFAGWRFGNQVDTEIDQIWAWARRCEIYDLCRLRKIASGEGRNRVAMEAARRLIAEKEEKEHRTRREGDTMMESTNSDTAL